MSAVPDGELHAPYFMEWSLGIEHQFGATRKRARSIRGHARGEPALFDASQRLSNRVPGLLCAVPLRAAHRSQVWGGDPIFHRRQQPLPWTCK